MDRCEKCGMPADEMTKCSCEVKVCYHCCSCEPECKCGCKGKEEKEKAE